MEGWTNSKRRVRLGKKVSPRPLKIKAWAYKDFKIGKLFTPQTGDTDLQQKDINGKGTFFINSGVEGLGIKGKTDKKARNFNPNTITVDFWGNAYYRDFKYKMATHNHVFSLSGDIIKNRSVGLYLVSSMSYIRNKFSYSNMGTWSKIKELSINLPITQSEKIDFNFMQSKIQEIVQTSIQEMNAYLNVIGFESCELTDEERNAVTCMNNGSVKYGTFFVTDDKQKDRLSGVFNVKNSHNILQSSIIPNSGNTPYVTAGEGNNSISTYVSYDESQIEEGNAIMIGGKTMVVTYQPDDFFSNDSHNLVLYAKNDTLKNEFIQLYMVTSLRKSLKPIYSWGDSISSKKIKKDKFSLPVLSSGDIDYKFMETYIRAQEKLAIQCLKNWLAQEMSQIVNDVNFQKKLVSCASGQQPQVYDSSDNSSNISLAAEDIIIPGCLEVRLHEIKRKDLLACSLELVLMYAISPVARKTTELAGKVALGIKEGNLATETIKAFESVKYIMFHYWKNSEAKAFELTLPMRLVSKSDIPEGYLVRQEKDAQQYLLIEYNPEQSVNIGNFDILKVQQKGNNRYIPFVCKVENLMQDK